MERSISLPFRTDIFGGIASTASPEAVLEHRVTSVLGTQPGERVMRPDYGCALQQFAFGVDDELVRAEMEALIRNAMTKWCPEARFISMEAISPGEDGIFVVRVTFASAYSDVQLESVVRIAIVDSAGGITETTMKERSRG